MAREEVVLRVEYDPPPGLKAVNIPWEHIISWGGREYVKRIRVEVVNDDA